MAISVSRLEGSELSYRCCLVHREPWVRYHSALSQILFLKDWGQFTKSDGPQCPNEKHIGEFRSVVLSQFGIAPQPSAVRGRARCLACTVC